MPGTVNGIGTTYHGKRNAHSEPGTCDHCKHDVVLRSYQTRVWFTFLYIPLIPLGRKQILRYCPRCTWHRSVPLGRWKDVGDDAIRKATLAVEQAPNDPSLAMGLLGTLVGFERHEEARAWAKMLAERFPDSAEVQLRVGIWHASEGRNAEADPCLAKALQLAPEDREVRRAAAIRAVETGELDRAKELLSWMLVPGGERDPSVLTLLAGGLQRAERHEEALELCGLALEAAPALGREKAFRRQVEVSERRLGRTASILPPPRSRRGLSAAVVVAVALVAVGLLLWNRHLASRQTLHVVNGLPARIAVSVDGGEPLLLDPGARRTVSLAEGGHEAVVEEEGAEDRRISFRVENSLRQRFSSKKSVFVLNPGGAATLLWNRITYSAEPRPIDQPVPYRLEFGVEFSTYRDVDHPFEEPPREIVGKRMPESRTVVQMMEGRPSEILPVFPAGTAPPRLLDFCELHLSLDPADEDLVQRYAMIAGGTGATDRAVEFLGRGLGRRPVAIEWHRMYQSLAEEAGKIEQLTSEYDRMVETEPLSASYYLRGRIEEEPAEAERLFARSVELDPKNPYPVYARGYRQALLGNFEEAERLCAAAVALKPGQPTMAELLFEVRCGLQAWAKLEEGLRKELGEKPYSFEAHVSLLRVLVLSEQTQKARAEHDGYTARVREVAPGQLEEVTLRSRMALEYLTGDLRACLSSAAGLPGPQHHAESFGPLLELGDLELAQPAASEPVAGMAPAYGKLLLAIAWSARGDAGKAKEWREQAVGELAGGGRDERKVAALLRLGEALDLRETEKIEAPLRTTAVVLVALADVCPPHRTALLDRAARLNVPGFFPWRFLERSIASLRAR